jgi:hypothetical protein
MKRRRTHRIGAPHQAAHERSTRGLASTESAGSRRRAMPCEDRAGVVGACRNGTSVARPLGGRATHCSQRKRGRRAVSICSPARCSGTYQRGTAMPDGGARVRSAQSASGAGEKVQEMRMLAIVKRISRRHTVRVLKRGLAPAPVPVVANTRTRSATRGEDSGGMSPVSHGTRTGEAGRASHQCG